MGFLHSRNGQSAVEVLIAIAILGMLATASFTLMISSFSEGVFSQQRADAQALLTESTEVVRQIRNRDFDLLTGGSHGLALSGSDWTFSGSSDVVDGFTRTVAVTEVDDEQRDVTITISWSPRPGRNTNVSSTTRFTSWPDPIIPTASNCYGYDVSGDWSNPVVLGSADIGSGNQGTDIAVSLPYAFVSGVATSSSKPDIFVYDVSNPASPFEVDNLDIGASGINSIAIWEDLLFAASSNDSKEFIIFDISNPTNITQIASTNLSGTANGISVTAKGDLIAVGRQQSSYNEIYFYDVSTPTSPTLLTSLSIPGDVNDFTTSEYFIYAVSSAADDDISVFDVTDPLDPTLVTSYDLEDGTQDISIAYHEPGLLFVGNIADKFITVDVSDPNNPVEVNSTTTGGEVKDMVCIEGDLLFIGTDNSNKEFMVLDISDLDNIVEYASLNFPQVTGGVEFAENKVFAAVRSNDALRIITSSP